MPILDALTCSRETVCKVRRITLNYSSSQTVNFDFIKALLLGGDVSETITHHTERKVKLKRADGKIHTVTEPEDKVYRVSFLKSGASGPIPPFPSDIFKRCVLRTARLVMCEDLRFKQPFTCIISCPRGSGKSSFSIKWLQNLKSLSTETKLDGSIQWCYGESNSVTSVDVGRKLQFHEGVPDNFVNVGNKSCLIILDDLFSEAYSGEVC